MLSFLCIIFGVFVSSRVILGSLKKKSGGPTIFHESFGRCLTWLSLYYFEGVREAEAAPLLESSSAWSCLSSFCYFSPERDFLPYASAISISSLCVSVF